MENIAILFIYLFFCIKMYILHSTIHIIYKRLSYRKLTNIRVILFICKR